VLFSRRRDAWSLPVTAPVPLAAKPSGTGAIPRRRRSCLPEGGTDSAAKWFAIGREAANEISARFFAVGLFKLLVSGETGVTGRASSAARPSVAKLRADSRKLGRRGGRPFTDRTRPTPAWALPKPLPTAFYTQLSRILPHMRLKLIKEPLEIVQHIDLELVIHLR
jgi:hypothetical protein